MVSANGIVVSANNAVVSVNDIVVYRICSGCPSFLRYCADLSDGAKMTDNECKFGRIGS